jgi:mannitol/fructose-specific phosphotransferase system IIA component
VTSAVLTRDLVVAPGTAQTKEEAIAEAGALLVGCGAVTPAYVEAMAARERLVSTYMGSWLAIPHGTDESKGDILQSALCLLRYDEPIEWGPDQPVRVVVGIAGVGEEHLAILSKIALIFSDPEEVDKVLAAPGADEIYGLIQQVNG